MGGIRIQDIAYVRFSAPDLEKMRAFLVCFGLHPKLEPDGVLYARGAGIAPFLHATEKGEAAFRALGLRAESVDDLEKLAAAEHARVEHLAAPGGGYCIRLKDPSGHAIEVVAGQLRAEPLARAPEPPHNTFETHPRERKPLRVGEGPSTVARLGHAVLEVADFRAAEAWYKERFGFITSDEIQPSPGTAIGAFLRCDRGDELTDHHTLFLLQGPRGPRFNHAAFEVSHFDDLMRGHEHLKRSGYTPAWGVGRHLLGSQVFDYWQDPWGHELEHWTDGDLFTAADGSNTASLADLLAVQWGQQHPMMAGR
jgi:catechol 2,3-dioxygenase-like lactoylglutathione lyase family enzyme